MRKKKAPLKKLNIQHKPTVRQTTSTSDKYMKNNWIDDADKNGDIKLKKLGTVDFN